MGDLGTTPAEHAHNTTYSYKTKSQKSFAGICGKQNPTSGSMRHSGHTNKCQGRRSSTNSWVQAQTNKQLLRRSVLRALKILQCGPDTHLPQPAVLGVDSGKAKKNEAEKCACAVKIRVACCAACRFASEAPHVHTTPSLRLDTSGEWDDTWSHGDEMTHG